MHVLKETNEFLCEWSYGVLPWMEKCFENFTIGWEARCNMNECPQADDFMYLFFWSELKARLEKDLKDLLE